jgi:hypothetical protein
MATLDKTIPPADARSDHLPRKRDKPVTCLDDFQFASALNRDRIALLRLHVPHPVLWEVYAARNKEEIYLAIRWFVDVTWLKCDLCGEADRSTEHLNGNLMCERRVRRQVLWKSETKAFCLVIP